jgi:predicted transcriptional regulator
MVSPSLETDKSPVSCEADAMSVMAITCGCDELVLVRFVDTSKLPSTLALMEVHLTPEQQRQLGELASHRGRDAGALAQEAISRYLAEEARFIEAVKLGEAALDRVEYLTHEQVGKRIDQLSRPRCGSKSIGQLSPRKTWNEYSAD